MKFKIMWLEWHNPDNWDGEENIKKALDCKITSVSSDDGWVECEIIREFEADCIEEAKKKTADYDIPEGVFSVMQDGKVIFTEEDISD